MPKRYWLFKSEPETFSIDDLRRSPRHTASWDGVRNYQARNFLRDSVQLGDALFFYHSSTKETGIAGTAIVVKGGTPDRSAMDSRSPYYDPRSTAEVPIWYAVGVRFGRKFRRIISLSELKRTPGLENMLVCRKGNRLSITPVTAEEWNIVLSIADAPRRRS
jgi:predicted RNA-binding protein with PUA-like domain